jgi:hypothetical protein
MQRIFAIAKLTWKAAFRFRLFWVLAGLLLVCVVALPALIKDDGTARGFTQILLTYTLGIITTLLGFSTLWLACGTLARDIEEAQMQVVAVKPIARWQIWLGKWCGIAALNAALLLLAGGSVFFLMKWRAGRLPPDQQKVLRNEIFVARGSLKETKPDLETIVEAEFEKIIKERPIPPEEHERLRTQLRERVAASEQVVPPGYLRRWTIDLGLRKVFLRDQPLFLRIKFFAAQTNMTGTYVGLWQVGPPGTDQARSIPMSLAADTFHEFAIPPNRFDDSGKLTIEFVNRNDIPLLFSMDEGLEVLYREGGFGLNFVRGLLIIWFWLALLAAIGLAAASFLSFPVAAFFSATLLVVGLSSSTLSNVVSEGTALGVNHETGSASASWVDSAIVQVFSAMLNVVKLVEDFSPVDSLSTGRSISWGTLAFAFLRIVVLFGGIFAAIGIAAFTRRELATAQSTA